MHDGAEHYYYTCHTCIISSSDTLTCYMYAVMSSPSSSFLPIHTPVIPVLLLVTCYLQVTHVTASSSPTYLGCYDDHVDVRERSLPYVQYLDKEITIDKCVEKCNKLGFEYSGLEFASECYCSKHPPRYEKKHENICKTPCAGSPSDTRPCGGSLALAVYHTSNVIKPERKRPLLCLVMMVKDEAHTIVKTLETVKSMIDCWVILDTGSTDGTQKIMTDYLHPLPGKLFEEKFVDYGTTRNRLLDLARDHYNPTFTLMLSADEQVLNPQDLRTFLDDHEWSQGSQHDAYPVVMNAGNDFDSVRVARVDGKWRYVGRVHEYLTSPQKQWVDLYRFTPEVRVQFKATDESRRFRSQYHIIKVLLEDLADNPKDTRALIYLGRTYALVGNHTEAFKYWDQLARVSTNREEQYHAMMMKAEASTKMGNDWAITQDILFEAYAFHPIHMNALHAIAQHYFDSSRFELSLLYATRAVEIERPKILDKSNPNYKTMETYLRDSEYLYDYEGHRLLGFAADRTGQHKLCAEALKRATMDRPDDSYALKTLRSCQQKAGMKVDDGDWRSLAHSVNHGDVSHAMDEWHLDSMSTHSYLWFLVAMMGLGILIYYIRHPRRIKLW